MANIIVTPQLASIIKRERTNASPKLSAKELSLAIDKSDTYISTLERGNIKKLDSKLFIKIFRKIKICSDEEFQNYINQILNDAFTSLHYNEKELKHQEWILQLSLIIRKIPIPKTVVEFIKNSLDELNITVNDLTRKINENIYLPSPEDFEYNTLKVFDNGRWGYKYKLNDTILEKILSSDTKSCNYITMLGITYNIYLLQGNDDQTAQQKANMFLSDNQFYNLRDIHRARNIETKKKENQNDDDLYSSLVLPEYEISFNTEFEKLKKRIREYRDMNIESALPMIKSINENLSLDLPFTNFIYKISFAKLFKDLTVEQKKEFLSNLLDLIKDSIEKNKSTKDTYYDISD
ncbi:hypothetical protein DVW08_05810 [Clostridium botulinum]|nr:hypothetical protein [Clostridium botulinum]